MNIKKIYKIIIFTLLTVFTCILLLLPLIYFLLNFESQEISDDISHWGSFGDYIGGTLNTIISILSLIILSVLTYSVSKQSSTENKKVNLLLRRLDAYEELTAYFPKVNQFMMNFGRFTLLLSKKFDDDSELHSIDETKKDLYNQVQFFSDFYYFLFTFQLRFGHLFDYDFKSGDYKIIVENAEKLNIYFESARASFEFGDNRLKEYDHSTTEKLFDDLTKFINTLRNELN